MSSQKKRVPLMVDQVDLKRWRAHAAKEGVSLSQFVRSATNRAVFEREPAEAALDLIERTFSMGPEQRRTLAILATERFDDTTSTHPTVASRAPRSARKKP